MHATVSSHLTELDSLRGLLDRRAIEGSTRLRAAMDAKQWNRKTKAAVQKFWASAKLDNKDAVRLTRRTNSFLQFVCVGIWRGLILIFTGMFGLTGIHRCIGSRLAWRQRPKRESWHNIDWQASERMRSRDCGTDRS